MAEHDCNSENNEEKVTPSIIRRNKVSYARQYPDYNAVPALILKGKWLADAGFTTDMKIDIRVMNNCLVITTREPEQEEPEVIKSLRKLSARKQKQAAELIATITAKGWR